MFTYLYKNIKERTKLTFRSPYQFSPIIYYYLIISS